VIANRLAGKLSVARLLGLGIGLVVFGATALFAVVALNNVSLIALGIPLAIIAIGNGPVLATAPALAMNSTDKPTGASAAMLLTITSILASSTVIIEGLVSDGTSWSLAVMLGSVALIALIMYFVATIGKSDAELDLLAVED